MKSTPNILSNIAHRGLIKEYAFFIELKFLFSNSVIYKDTIKKLPEIMGYSRTKINRGIKVIIDEGWGFWSSQNLCLKSTKNIHLLYDIYEPKFTVTINNIDDIYLELLKNKIRQKDFIASKVSDLKSYSRKVVKAAYKKLGGEKEITDDGLSLKTLTKVFNMSVTQVARIIKNLRLKGFISVQKRFESYGQFNYHYFLELQSKYKGIFRSKGNNIIRVRSNKITILEYNIIP